jgi:tellurite resistance protein
MRKLLIVGAVAATLALAGCSGPNLVDAYHKVARAMPAYSNMHDDQLDKAGKAICKAFDADRTTAWDATVEAVSESSDQAQAGVFVRAAVAAYCPQYKGDLPN